MPLDRPRFVASVDLDEVRSALSEWRWLLRENAWAPLLVSAAGDVFLARESGEVFRLDTGSGELTQVARTISDFEASLEDAAVVEDWLLTPVVNELLNSGHSLPRGQCFGFAILPVFKEGSYAAHNRFPLSVLEHIRITGDLHARIQGVEDGQRIRLSVVE